MTPAQVELVRKSFVRIVLNLDQVSTLFFDRLHELNPELGSMFRGDAVIQRIKLGAALAGLVGSLGQLDRILPPLRDLGRKRARQGINAEHHALVGEALIWSLEHVLGDDFTTETRRAWIAAYGFVAWTMISAAEQNAIEVQAA